MPGPAPPLGHRLLDYVCILMENTFVLFNFSLFLEDNAQCTAAIFCSKKLVYIVAPPAICYLHVKESVSQLLTSYNVKAVIQNR